MEDLTQQIRDRIMQQISEILPEFLRNLDDPGAAIRILGDTPNSVLDPTDYLGSISPFAMKVQDCLRDFNADNRTCFVAVNIYRGKHSYFVIDLNNNAYDYQTAHQCKTPIPVYVCRLSKRKPRIFRKRELDGDIAEMLRTMHNGHGQDPLPLFDNYCDENLQYRNPRSLQT